MFISRVLISECDKVHVIKELLNVKYNSATVYVLDLAHIVFSIETLRIE